MPLHHIHPTGVEADPDCDCEQCLALSPSKKPRRNLTFVPSPPENPPIVKGNNRYGAKGTIRCLACQRRKGKCEFPLDKPEVPCEHCKRRGLRCGDKLPTERKRQLNQSQDEHSYVRTLDPSWPTTPTSAQSQYRYGDDQRQYSAYLTNGLTPRPVAPALPSLPEPRPTLNYAPRPYNPAPPPSVPRAPTPPQFPYAADLVREIEMQITKISLAETFAVARCLGSDHGLIGNSNISDFVISRKNQEFSRGDSWFNVQWYKSVDGRHPPVPRSVNLRFEPGRQLCTSYPDDSPQPPPRQHQSQHHMQNDRRQEDRLPITASAQTDMELDPPKHVENWSGLVGDLFDKAADIVHEQSQFIEKRSTSPEQPSTALWSQKAWHTILTLIKGRTIEGKSVYTYGLPHATFGVIVERCKNFVDVFWSPDETQPINCQNFVNRPARKKISLKTVARVLGKLSALRARAPQSAGESCKLVQEILETVNADEPVLASSPKKRRFEELENEHVKVKTERSMSTGSSLSGTTSASSVPTVKIEADPVDEETSNAASILNGVAKNRRPVDVSPSPMSSYSPPSWSPGDKAYPPPSYYPSNTPWLYNSYASPETASR